MAVMILSPSLALGLLMLLMTTVHGFFPSTFREVAFGKFGTSHESQTKQAFEELAKEFFPEIPKLTNKMLAARDQIASANEDVDDDQDHSALHFDGENLPGGMKRLVDLKKAAKDALLDGNGPEAREQLGHALHTLQDFYAHSNWVELGYYPRIFESLGNKVTTSFAPWDERTCNDECGEDTVYAICRDCAHNNVGFNLTTGYYFGEDSPAGGVAIPPWKCHHGGATDNPNGLLGVPNSQNHIPGGINKDSNNCRWSPHHELHSQAVELSIKATKQFIREIINDLHDIRKTKLLFGLGTQLAFAIDTTESMGKIISNVKQEVAYIINKRRGTPDEPTSYVVAPFNDPYTGPVLATTDPDEFISFLDSLVPSGGGDCPELPFTGCLDALDFMQGPGELFLFTDAPPKDYMEKFIDVVDTAQYKEIKTHIYDFLSCENPNEQKKRASKREYYRMLAAKTGGSYHQLDQNSDLGNLTHVLDVMTKQNVAGILKQEINVGQFGHHIVFPVDSTIKELTIHIRTESPQFFSFFDPKGYFSLSGNNVQLTVLSGEVIVTVTNPNYGTWEVHAENPGKLYVDVSGLSDLHFNSFNFVAIGGRPGHSGYFPIKTPPAYDHVVAAIAEVVGEYRNPRFEMRNVAGDTVTTMNMASKTGGGDDVAPYAYWGEVQLTADTVQAYVTGLDRYNLKFQRYNTRMFSPIISGTKETGINNTDPWGALNDPTSTTSTTTPTSTTGPPTKTPSSLICPEDGITFPAGPPSNCTDGLIFEHNGWAYIQYCQRDSPDERDTPGQSANNQLDRYGYYHEDGEWHWGDLNSCLDWCSADTRYSWDPDGWQCRVILVQNGVVGCSRRSPNADYIMPDDPRDTVPNRPGYYDYAVKLTSNICLPKSVPNPRATACPKNQTIPAGPRLICEEGAFFTSNGSTYQSFCNRRELQYEELETYDYDNDYNFTRAVTKCSKDPANCAMVAANRDGGGAAFYHEAPDVPSEPGPIHYAIDVCGLPKPSQCELNATWIDGRPDGNNCVEGAYYRYNGDIYRTWCHRDSYKFGPGIIKFYGPSNLTDAMRECTDIGKGCGAFVTFDFMEDDGYDDTVFFQRAIDIPTKEGYYNFAIKVNKIELSCTGPPSNSTTTTTTSSGTTSATTSMSTSVLDSTTISATTSNSTTVSLMSSTASSGRTSSVSTESPTSLTKTTTLVSSLTSTTTSQGVSVTTAKTTITWSNTPTYPTTSNSTSFSITRTTSLLSTSNSSTSSLMPSTSGSSSTTSNSTTFSKVSSTTLPSTTSRMSTTPSTTSKFSTTSSSVFPSTSSKTTTVTITSSRTTTSSKKDTTSSSFVRSSTTSTRGTTSGSSVKPSTSSVKTSTTSTKCTTSTSSIKPTATTGKITTSSISIKSQTSTKTSTLSLLNNTPIKTTSVASTTKKSSSYGPVTTSKATTRSTTTRPPRTTSKTTRCKTGVIYTHSQYVTDGMRINGANGQREAISTRARDVHIKTAA